LESIKKGKKVKTVIKRYKVEKDGTKTPVAVTPLAGFKEVVLSRSVEVTPTGTRKVIITRSLTRSSSKEEVKVKKELKIVQPMTYESYRRVPQKLC
jgi:hypothetical protein